MPQVTNQHILKEIEKLRVEEIRPLRQILIGNGEPERGVCYRLERVSEKLDQHIEKANGKDKKILGMDTELRSTLIKNAIRIVNFATAAFLLYITYWLSQHGVELKKLIETVSQ